MADEIRYYGDDYEDGPGQPEFVRFAGNELEPPDDSGDWTWCPGATREWRADQDGWVALGWWERRMRDDERLTLGGLD